MGRWSRLVAVLCLVQSVGCAGAWYEPSEVEARTDWTEIDHDQDVYDGASMTYGVSLKWPLGAQRRAYEEQYGQSAKLDRIAAAVEREAPPPTVVVTHTDVPAPKPFNIFGVEMPYWMSSDKVVAGLPLFVWGGGVLLMIAAALWILNIGGVKQRASRLRQLASKLRQKKKDPSA